MTWTKGFKATDCEGEDVVELLRDAIKRKEVTAHGRHVQVDPAVAGAAGDVAATAPFRRRLRH